MGLLHFFENISIVMLIVLLAVFKLVDPLWLYNHIIFSQDTINILRGLLCEYPEFLCEHHYEFIGAMSAQCIEMRNLVSCAYPRYMHLPDPMNPGPNIDMLPEIQQRPQISPIYVKMSASLQPVRYLYLLRFMIYRYLINSRFVQHINSMS